MEKIRAIIIDDETPARELIKHYLHDCENIKIIAECADGFSGLKSITVNKPDIVFLDIQMPRLTGLELIEVMTEKPVIIFTTAYDQYAIKAFELNAVDYLLKPFPKRRFMEALNKAMEKIHSGNVNSVSAQQLMVQRPEPTPVISRIVVRKGNAISMIPVEQIRYFEAQDDYVMIYHTEGKALKQQTMKFYEKAFPVSDFVRIHRSYIVRIEAIKKIEPYGKDNHIAVLHSGEKLPVSKNGYKHLKEELNF